MAVTGSFRLPVLGTLVVTASRLVGFSATLGISRAASLTVSLGSPVRPAVRRPFGRAGRVGGIGGGAHDHLGALAQLVGAVDHDAIAGCQPREHLDPVTIGDAELDRS